MKASEMICLLAKQIEMNGDRDVTLYVDGEYTEAASPKSVTWDSDAREIEIYGE
tara:strand:+ start:96 stop:257 length:162 start_codon:yes stop_codon:yes gene_type:complete